MKEKGAKRGDKNQLVEYIGSRETTKIPNQENNDTMCAAKEHKKSGRNSEEQDIQEQKHIMKLFLGVGRQYFGKWKDLFRGVSEKREAGKILYPIEVLLFTGTLMFVCQLGARRQINYKLRMNAAVRKKYHALFGVEDIPHGDTLNYTYQRVKVEEVQEIVCRMMEKLMGEEEIRQWRLFDTFYLIAIDGTGVLTYSERHCDYCLTRKLNNGTTLYYHPVLEAKLVTANGYALSLMTEFIENRDPQASKQDCELKAFYRLADRLKQRFPNANFCLLLDGLFAGGPTLEICEQQKWKYFITLTDADLPTVNEEFEALLALPPENRREIALKKGGSQTHRWMNCIEYVDSDQKAHSLNVLECVETTPDKHGQFTSTKFKWLTNFFLLSNNSPTLANQAGRLRWKVENEGFNLQKNDGFELEHVFSRHETAHKVFYLLLQIATIFFQLMAKSAFFHKTFPYGVGSLKNIAFRLLEAWRNLRLDDQAFLALTVIPPDSS